MLPLELITLLAPNLLSPPILLLGLGIIAVYLKSVLGTPEQIDRYLYIN